MKVMEFFRRAEIQTSKLGILSGSFHPPTRAHLALAEAALEKVDEVVFVLPRVFPHKAYEKTGFEDRMRLLLEATAGEPRFSVATTDGGLFIEIVRECGEVYASGTEFWFLCGRDAAERIVNWNYGVPGVFLEMLDEFGLLVADRGGHYEPPDAMKDRIIHLPLPEDYDSVSATEVRERIKTGQPWEALVPAPIVAGVKEIYGGG